MPDDLMCGAGQERRDGACRFGVGSGWGGAARRRAGQGRAGKDREGRAGLGRA